MSRFNRDELEAMVRAEALNQNLPYALVAAVIEQESGWNVYASRYEPAFFKKYVSKQYPEQNTESIARATSFGLMQLMGQVARELGFDDIQLSNLMDPSLNLRYGCTKLAKCMTGAQKDVSKALLKWNGGGSPQYAMQVMQRMGKYAS